MDELIVEYIEQYNFNKVYCSEGHYITDWNGEDIFYFHATKVLYCPPSINAREKYHCITEAQYEAFMRQLEEAEAAAEAASNEE